MYKRQPENRAQTALLLWNTAGRPEPAEAPAFKDVADPDTAKDIEPFMTPKFADNIILTKTERLMMSNRPPDPKNARNKNVLVVGCLLYTSRCV